MATRLLTPEGIPSQSRGPIVLWWSVVALARDSKARIPLAVLFVIWILAYLRLFVDATSLGWSGT